MSSNALLSNFFVGILAFAFLQGGLQCAQTRWRNRLVNKYSELEQCWRGLAYYCYHTKYQLTK